MLEVGKINELKVNRKTDIGYMLEDKEAQVFLHNNECDNRELNPNDKVLAFLYFDHKNRLAATLKTPIISLNEQAFLKVKTVNKNLGVFLDLGIGKDLLLSKDDLPYDYDLWPKEEDLIYCELRLKSRLIAKIPAKQHITLKAENELKLKDRVTAYVYRIGNAGINALSIDGHDIFIHKSLANKTYRLGEEILVTITYISENGYSGSLNLQKEAMMLDDAKIILDYLILNDEMPLTSDSSPSDILKLFKMSKKAFKRAIGILYKERKIDFVDDKTILVKAKKVK